MGDLGDEEKVLVLLAVLLALAIIIGFAVYIGGQVSNRITEDKAMARFQELAQNRRVEMIRHSNDMFLFGNPHDVTYELLVDGKPTSGRCVSGTFSPMVCRLYRLEE